VKTEKRSLDINRVQELKTFALSSVQQGDHDFTVSLAACKHYRHQQQNSWSLKRLNQLSPGKSGHNKMNKFRSRLKQHRTHRNSRLPVKNELQILEKFLLFSSESLSLLNFLRYLNQSALQGLDSKDCFVEDWIWRLQLSPTVNVHWPLTFLNKAKAGTQWRSVSPSDTQPKDNNAQKASSTAGTVHLPSWYHRQGLRRALVYRYSEEVTKSWTGSGNAGKPEQPVTTR
jgi:hypothetical protein